MIERVAGTAEVAKRDAERVIDAFFDAVKHAVKRGERVAWPSFGAFSVSNRKARTGRNPRTGQPVKIAASKALKFSPASAAKDFLNSAGGGAGKKSAPARKAAGSAKGGKASSAKKSAGRATAKKASKATRATKKR
jgi:DNA-binding protein HU-beta